MNKIYITGISGTGKSTVAKELHKKGYSVISIDETPDLCFWINKETKERVFGDHKLDKNFIDSHNWICNIEHLKKLILNNTKPLFATGVVSNQADFIDLFDKTILLQCKPETFISRIENRKDNDFGKDKTAQEVILGWYKKFENELLEKGAISISTEDSLEEVVNNIIKESNY